MQGRIVPLSRRAAVVALSRAGLPLSFGWPLPGNRKRGNSSFTPSPVVGSISPMYRAHQPQVQVL